MPLPRSIIYEKNRLVVLDQRKLPYLIKFYECKRSDDVVYAIRNMVVRGAPLIGITAAFGFYLGVKNGESPEEVYAKLRDTRPTAVNLVWALKRVMSVVQNCGSLEDIYEECVRIYKADVETNKKIGMHGAQVIKDGYTVLTHCNAGALATSEYGTALGVIRAAIEQGKSVNVIADETRPRLQGAALTALELHMDNIPVKIISDNMAGFVMRRGLVDVVIIGADRIARNGDVANKIGSYMLALAAKHNDIPFYVAAPTSTVDTEIESGDEIPIEIRDSREVLEISGIPVAPEGVDALNFAFDITPAELITGIITERGIYRPEDIFRAVGDMPGSYNHR